MVLHRPSELAALIGHLGLSTHSATAQLKGWGYLAIILRLFISMLRKYT